MVDETACFFKIFFQNCFSYLCVVLAESLFPKIINEKVYLRRFFAYPDLERISVERSEGEGLVSCGKRCEFEVGVMKLVDSFFANVKEREVLCCDCEFVF